jgi:hypothetical protein
MAFKLSTQVFFLLVFFQKRQDSSVGVAMGYGLISQGSIPGRGKRLFFTPQCPDQ